MQLADSWAKSEIYSRAACAFHLKFVYRVGFGAPGPYAGQRVHTSEVSGSLPKAPAVLTDLGIGGSAASDWRCVLISRTENLSIAALPPVGESDSTNSATIDM
jgi:hypothetical protein